jgi:hypothetical protein
MGRACCWCEGAARRGGEEPAEGRDGARRMGVVPRRCRQRLGFSLAPSRCAVSLLFSAFYDTPAASTPRVSNISHLSLLPSPCPRLRSTPSPAGHVAALHASLFITLTLPL